MLGELQSFKQHKRLHCNESLFREGVEVWSAQPGRHSWTTAKTHSAPSTELCSNEPSAKTKGSLLSHGLNNKGRKNSPVTSFAWKTPVRNTGHTMEPTGPINIV